MTPPLTGLRVLEFAGLAPGPFCGLLCADYGADVVKLDRPTPNNNDNLTRGKRLLNVDLKSPSSLSLVTQLCSHADIIIDPYRPGVLEKLGLGPDVLCNLNPRLIYARLTGFRRDDRVYKNMAGHDINYLAISGALNSFSQGGGGDGRDKRPAFPANTLADFGGGGLVCFVGILLAVISRQSTGKGQVVEANMVDGVEYLSTFMRLAMQAGPAMGWGGKRGTNLLDGGAPFYDVYETADGGYMAVGALEPQFYYALLKGLDLSPETTPAREDRENWETLRTIFTAAFLTKTREEWENVFSGTDACVTPVKDFKDLRSEGHELRGLVELKSTPGVKNIRWDDSGTFVSSGKKAEKDILRNWCGKDEGSKL